MFLHIQKHAQNTHNTKKNAGIAIFNNLLINKVCSSCRLRFISGSLQGFSDIFNVVQGPPTAITFVQIPTVGVLGIDFEPQPSLQVTDRGGNVIRDTFTVEIYKAAGVGFLRHRFNILTTQSNGVNNTATFSLIFHDAASVLTLGFNVTFASGITIVKLAPVLIITGPAVKAQITSPVPANSTHVSSLPLPFAILVTVFDYLGQIVLSDTDKKLVRAHVSGGTPGAQLLGTTSVTTSHGVATFSNLSIDLTGQNYTIVFAGDSFPNISTTTFDIRPGKAANLAIRIQPSAVTAGVPITPSPQVAVQDSGGNIVPGVYAIGAVLQGEDGSSMGGERLVNTVNSIATFQTLAVTKAGPARRILFFSGGGLNLTILSAPFDIVAGSASQISVSIQPGAALRGVPLSRAPEVVLLDQYRNLVADSQNNQQVSVSILANPGGGTLGGVTRRLFSGGRAKFEGLSINNLARGYTLRFVANGTFMAVSETFDITGIAQSVIVTVQPNGAVGGATLTTQPRVAAIDVAGLVVATQVSNVTVSIGQNPAGGKLTPSTPFAVTTFGVAIFTEVSIDRAGTGYTLLFNVVDELGSILGTVASTPFDVAVGTPTEMRFVALQSSVVAGQRGAGPIATVAVVDTGGNIVVGLGEDSTNSSNGTNNRSSFFVNVSVDIVAKSGPIVQKFNVAVEKGMVKIDEILVRAGMEFTMRLLLVVNSRRISVRMPV
jgi:hypothetical protein